jgi:hypothetical protein
MDCNGGGDDFARERVRRGLGSRRPIAVHFPFAFSVRLSALCDFVVILSALTKPEQS